MRASYGWLLKWILAAILIGVGLTVFFSKNIVFLVTGIAILIVSIFRVVPLVKSLNKEVLRTLNIIEVLLDFLIGIVMVIVSYDALSKGQNIDGLWSVVYKYTLVAVLLLRSIVFLYSVVFLGEKTEQIKFWSHLAFLSIGSMILVLDKFNETWIAWLFLIISLIGGIYLIYDGTKGYTLYREFSTELNKSKQKNKDKKANIELPSNRKIDDEVNEDRPYVS